MTAKSEQITVEQEQLADTLPTEPIVIASETAVDMNKLASLKAKAQAKQVEQKIAEAKAAVSVATKKEVSLNFGVVGSGQGGSRLAEAFFKLGYDAVAINTAMQDLKFINIPDANKLLLEQGIGGAAKELEIGRMASETHKAKIAQLIQDRLQDSQVNIFCLSLGGGSGAGSCETLVDILTEVGKPLMVMTILPMDTEDAQTKKNALETLAKLAKLTQSKKIANLIVVDNAKLETIYQNVSQTEFFEVANKAIVEPLDIFNVFSSRPSSTKPLDPMELSKLLLDGEGLSVYGEISISNFAEDTALAEAVINNLDGNLLASGFDLKQTKYVGVIFAASAAVWQAIPSSSVNYALAMINDKCSSPSGIFKGIYTVDMPEKVVKVYSIFSGLALPEARIEQLKKETKELATATKNKDEQRNLFLKLDTGNEENVSAAQKIKEKIAAKSSNFGKFVSGVSDRRK
jgi:cell division GTPase FtsZ